MLNLKDTLTIIIPTAIDTADRKRNLKLNLNWLRKHIDCEIIVVECDDYQKASKVCSEYGATHIFEQLKEGESLNQNRCLNIGACKSKTPVIAKVDTDCFVMVGQYERATHFIARGRADLIYPYDGRFHNIMTCEIEKFVGKEFGIDMSKVDYRNVQSWGEGGSVGGIQFYNRESFWKYGGACEVFTGWGYEDHWVVESYRLMGARVLRVQDPIFHLEHQRLNNEFYTSKHKQNQQTLETLRTMTKDQYQLLLDSVDWSKE